MVINGIVRPPEPGEEPEATNPLLQTVGGTRSIIDISRAVANGEMTEAAAESLLQEIFGFTQSTSARLIDVPKPEPVADVTPTIQPEE